VAGVLGAEGEETVASRFDCAPLVGVSSCSVKGSRRFGVELAGYAKGDVSNRLCCGSLDNSEYRDIYIPLLE
jgi:hypothetical protein